MEVKNPKIFFITFFIVLFLIITLYLDSGYFSEDSNTYSSVVMRLSIFFLGSIVTMSIFIYNSKQKLSAREYIYNSNFYLLVIGIASALISLITVPSDVYVYRKGDWRNIEWSIPVIMDTLSWINLIVFLLSLCTFLLVLFNFINSFRVEENVSSRYYDLLNTASLKQISEEKFEEIPLKIDMKTSEELCEKLEILNQNIIYLVDLNNIALTQKYLTKWENINDYIITLIYHTEYPKNSSINGSSSVAYKKNLFETLISLNKRIIYHISNNGLLKKESIGLIKLFLKFSPKFHDKFFDIYINESDIFNSESKHQELLQDRFSFYIDNQKELSPLFYTELYSLFCHLHKSTHPEIYRMLLSKDLSIDDFYNTSISQTYFNIVSKSGIINQRIIQNIGDLKNNQLVEDMFSAMLFTIVEDNNNQDLPSILALLFKVQYENLSFEKKRATKPFIGAMKEEESEKTNTFTEINDELKITDFSVQILIVSIIKALEIENYRAAGYLLKRLCNHVQWPELKNNILEIKKKLFEENLDSFNINTSRLSLNRYSLSYCYKKAILLIALQLAYNNDYKIISIPLINDFVKPLEQKKIIDSLLDRKKDYGLPCIDEKNINRYKKIFDNV